MSHATAVAIALCVLLAGVCLAQDDATLGHWPFDGSLQDASGAGLHAVGEAPRYARGVRGQALDPDWTPVEVPSTVAVELSAGLTIECWVYWDELPRGYEQIIIKDMEYQLRVDSPAEGGQISFFVHLDGGWEPRVRGPVPEPGRWHHLIASWSGTEISLEADGQRVRRERRGVPAPTDNPVRIGHMSGRLDDLTLSNPIRHRLMLLHELIEATPPAERTPQAQFTGPDGWAGWQAVLGGEARVRDAALHATLPDPVAAIVSPVLDVDVRHLHWLSVDVEAPEARLATVSFITDAGEGSVAFPVWGGGRTSYLNLAGAPQWSGRLRLLALSFPEREGQEAVLSGLQVSREPAGRPYLYARSFAPGRAALRAGREETILATVRNLGRAATNVLATLDAPAGVAILQDAAQAMPDMGHDATEMVSWRVRAERPVTGEFALRISADDCGPAEARLAAAFTPPVNLPPADYVPPPRPVETEYLTLMHYCPLWKEGTHYGWGRIEPWPDRRPAIGWYDEGTPEVADWHIKYAREHGIDGFIYCWYRANFNPEIEQHIGHALQDGMLNARYLDQFKFVIMWENGCAKGVESREDMMENLLPFWIENYFKHPSYVVIDNKPLLYVWRPERVAPELGGSEATREVFEEMREALRREGFDGLYIVGCVETPNRHMLERMALEGWDASGSYAVWSTSPLPPGRDVEGITTHDYETRTMGQRDVWEGKKEIGALPDIITVMMGWDPRPWHGRRTSSYIADPDPEVFRAACRAARDMLEATPGNGLDKRIVVFDNWNEFGEGHYIEPTSGFGFTFLDAIKEVFAPDAGPCLDITPEDVGLAPPEHVYLARREMLGGLDIRQRTVEDNLVAWWRFEDDDDHIARDSSACEFHGFKDRFVAAEGIRGRGFGCTGGSVAVGANRLFWPLDGITVELWFNAEAEEQSDRWMVNTVGAADTGWRLGFGGGKVVWQIPKTAWSHNLTAPEPAPLGVWTHVAATYDNETMRLYIDGEQVGSLVRGGPIHPSDAALHIGSYSASHPRAYFEGVLDEVRVWDRALSAQEVGERFGEGGR